MTNKLPQSEAFAGADSRRGMPHGRVSQCVG